jgi:hypothetical protein
VIAMTDFRDQDLTGARFENVSLRRASRRMVDLSGAQLRSVMLHGTRMRGVELCDVDIYGELQHVVINGVDIAPLVEAELNRRMPDRAKCVPATATGSGKRGRSWSGCGRTRSRERKRSRRPRCISSRRNGNTGCTPNVI